MAGEEELFRALNGAGSNPVLDAAALLLDVSAAVYVIAFWGVHLWLVKKRVLAYDFLLALLVTVVLTEVLKFGISVALLFWELDAWPRYARLRIRVIGRWLSPDPGGRSGSSSRPGRGPASPSPPSRGPSPRGTTSDPPPSRSRSPSPPRR